MAVPLLLAAGPAAAENADALQIRSASEPAQSWARAPFALKSPTFTGARWEDLIQAAARREALPQSVLTNLLARESGFFPFAVSRAGAQGIAQFMPATGSSRSLEDPFDPRQAIPAAAAYLSELRRRFGNLGLAVAAYNAGPGRVSNWLAGSVSLPNETVAYVRAVTGRDIGDWAPSRVASAANASQRYKRGSAKLSEAGICAGLATSGQSCIVRDAY